MGFPEIAAGAALGGAAISAIGQIRQGEAASAEAKYQAQVAENNKVIAQQNANYVLATGEQETYLTGLRERAKAGQITAGYGANEIDPNSGSAAQARMTQAETGQLAEETTGQTAALRAYGYRAAATSYGAEATLKRAEAPMDVTAGFLGAGGTLLGSAGNLGFKWNAITNPTAGGAVGGGLPFGE